MQYSFGDYTLDLQRDELRAAGGVVRLDPQVFAVLAYLVQHRDRVVRRQELFEQLWPERFVSEAALERCIAVARRAVGDSGRSQCVIQTVHGRGYRFIALVEERRGEESAVEAPVAPDMPGAAKKLFPDYAERGLPPAPGVSEQSSTLVSTPGTPGSTWPAGPGTPEAERRQLTVLVCRLVGLPEEHAAPLDPEALLEVVPDYHTLCAEVVRRFAGYMAPDQVDGLVVYFGYPQAHEDDACRAVYTGLEIVEAMQRFQARRGPDRGMRFAVRVGIHTGLVVMSTPGHDDPVRHSSWARRSPWPPRCRASHPRIRWSSPRLLCAW